MREFKSFIEENIAVSFKNEEELKLSLELCEKNGLTWGSNSPATTPFYPGDRNEGWKEGIVKQAVMYHGYRKPIRSLEYCDAKWFYSKYRAQVVAASEFLQPKNEIKIFQSGKTAVCLKYQDGKVVARGTSKCHHDDEYDFNYGASLALLRMVNDKSINTDQWVTLSVELMHKEQFEPQTPIYKMASDSPDKKDDLMDETFTINVS